MTIPPGAHGDNGEQRRRLAVIAFGGNALHPQGEKGTQREQLRNARRAARFIVRLLARGYHPVLVHGNGPQVGNILIQMEEAATKVPAFAIDVAVAMSQGSMGFMISVALMNELIRRKHPPLVTTLMSMVLVDENDPAFLNPSKPIGPFFTAYRAAMLMRKKRWRVIEDAGRGYRRVVPSPKPQAIIGLDTIKHLVAHGHIIIACGGGGIPVVKTENGYWRGVEAVIDKDYTSALLAGHLGADLLLILTNVPKVALFYGTPQQQWVDTMTRSEAQRHLAAGMFPPGSMGPKIEAAINYLEHGGKRTIITDIKSMHKAVAGNAGTHIVPDS